MPRPPLLFKVCGLRRQEDVDAAMDAKVHMCGFIFHEASPRYCTVSEAATLHSKNVLRVGVFVNHSAAQIYSIMNEAQMHMAQVHGCPMGMSPQEHAETCAHLVGEENIIHVCWPHNHGSLDSLQLYMQCVAPYCSLFLLDAGRQGGGHGQSLDWKSLEDLQSPHPWLLAGGLTPQKAMVALEQCRPHGLDFNSGIERAPGVKSTAGMNALKRINTKLNTPTQRNIL